jgi:ketosteroid isomerase-like protein
MSEVHLEQIHAELWSLYEDWFTAIAGPDHAFFEEVLADDWHYTNHLGEVRGKLEYFAYIAPIRHDGPVNTLVELVVRPFGAIVVVHGLYVIAAGLAPPGGPDTRFTAVWERQDGRWLALAHHATTVTSVRSG